MSIENKGFETVTFGACIGCIHQALQAVNGIEPGFLDHQRIAAQLPEDRADLGVVGAERERRAVGEQPLDGALGLRLAVGPRAQLRGDEGQPLVVLPPVAVDRRALEAGEDGRGVPEAFPGSYTYGFGLDPDTSGWTSDETARSGRPRGS